MLLTSDDVYGEEMQKEQKEEKPDFMVFAEMDVSGLEEITEFEDYDY